MSEDWLWMSAGDLGRGIEEGDIDPVALTETYLIAISTHRFRDRIYARLTESTAIAQAEAAALRARNGTRLGLLDGVPVSWKDLFDTAGVATEAGSALLKGRTPERDAEVVRNARAAGLVGLGKTHMSELAFSGLGYNPVTASPPCVNDTDAVSGGSSSGAAASIGFGLAAAGIGTDTGGSVRIPAAWNDLVGLKTTNGRLPLDGVVPLASSFDTVGPLCRNVEDAALLLAALEGRSRAADLAGAGLRGTRFLILKNGLRETREAPRAGFDSAVGRLMEAGAAMERAALDTVDEALAMASILFTTEAYATWQDVIEAHPKRMYHQVLERFRAGGQYSAVDYIAASKRLEEIRREYHALVAGYDAVILPTAAIMPPDARRLAADHEYYIRENLLALRNTRIGNLRGGAALTWPTGQPSTGIMYLGAPGSEERLLRIGAAAEAVLA